MSDKKADMLHAFESLSDEEKEAVFNDLDAMNTEIFESSLVKVSEVYLDIQFLKDLYVGELKLHSRTEAIFDKVTTYLKDEYLACTTLFPDKIYDELGIDSVLKEYHGNAVDYMKIMTLAPMTNMWKEIRDQIRVYTQTLRMIDNPGAMVTTTVNTYPAKLPQKAQQVLADFLCEMLETNIVLICRDPNQLRVDEMSSYDALFIFEFNKLMYRDELRQAFTDRKFFSTQFYVPMISDDQEHCSTEDFVKAESYMGILSEFVYLDRKLFRATHF